MSAPITSSPFASGIFCNSHAWPYFEIDFISTCNGGGHNTLDITINVTTANVPSFTFLVNTLQFNYTYLVINNGLSAAYVYLEVSPDGTVWQMQTELTKVNPGQLVTLVPDTIAKFSRLGYQSSQPGKDTSLTVFVQGVS